MVFFITQKHRRQCSGWKARATEKATISPAGEPLAVQGKIEYEYEREREESKKQHPKYLTSYSYSVRPGGRYSYSYSKNAH